MLRSGNQVRLTQQEAEAVKTLSGRNELPKTAGGLDRTLEFSAQEFDDGTPEGRLLAGMLRLSKADPDEIDVVADEE